MHPISISDTQRVWKMKNWLLLEAKSIFLLPGHLLYLFCNNDDDRRASGDFRTESINKLINTIICLLGFDSTEIKYNQVINRRGEIWRGLLYFSNGSFRRRRGAAALRRRRREGAILNYSCTRYSTQAGSTITDDMTIARTMSMSTMSMSIMMATLRNRLPAQGTEGSLRWSQCSLCTLQLLKEKCGNWDGMDVSGEISTESQSFNIKGSTFRRSFPENRKVGNQIK